MIRYYCFVFLFKIASLLAESKQDKAHSMFGKKS